MRARPFTVGLTGGLASGKSTVAARFAELGAAVIDADAVVHELYGAGEEGAEAVTSLFGFELLNGEGAVHRGALAQRVLADRNGLAALNAAIHPMVKRRIRCWLAEVSAAVAVVEAALLVETGSYRDYDLLVVVWCDEAQQMARALGRGVAEVRARQLLGAQMSLVEKRERAHLVIDNSGSPEELVVEIDRVWREILQRCSTTPTTPSRSRC